MFIVPMTGFELQTSGIGSDRSSNLATTTAHLCNMLLLLTILKLIGESVL